MSYGGIGRYRLLGELGRGGMSDVFLARAEAGTVPGALVVVKRLRILDDPQWTAMFLDEARIARRLHHPNLVRTHEVGLEDGHHFIVMEYLPGLTVQQIRRAVRPEAVPAPIEIAIVRAVLAGLHHAHELCDGEGQPLNVVHRDLSRENVVVTRSGGVKVLDFGIAKADDSLTFTQAGQCKGRLRNMPPEQLRCEKLDRRADVYAAGVLLWEGLAGRPLWAGMSDAVVAARLASGQLPPLRPLGPATPGPLLAVCERALAPRPEERFATAAEMAAELAAACGPPQAPVAGAPELAAFIEPLFAPERTRVDQIVASQGSAALDRLVTLPPRVTGVRRRPLGPPEETTSYTGAVATAVMSARLPPGAAAPASVASGLWFRMLAGIALALSAAALVWAVVDAIRFPGVRDASPAPPRPEAPAAPPARGPDLDRLVPAASQRQVWRPPAAPGLRRRGRARARDRGIDLTNPYRDVRPGPGYGGRQP